MQDTSKHHSLPLNVRYFDGKSSQAHEAQVWVEDSLLQIQGSQVARTCQLNQVIWPERSRHGPRLGLLPEGGSIQSDDFSAWDTWARTTLGAESITVQWHASWLSALLCMGVLVALIMASYVWGLPWLSQQVARHVPETIEAQIGDEVLRQISSMIAPSQLPPKDQAAIEQRWSQVLQAHTALQKNRGLEVRPTRLLIRHIDIGPNALALPGGVIILTDDMVRLLQNDHAVIAGVLAHELGHVQHRDSLKMLVQVGVMGLAASLLWGDYGGILAAVPVWLGQAHYSRTAELAADAYSVTVLRDAQISPEVMVTLFERLKLLRRCERAVLEQPLPTGSSPAPPCHPETHPVDPAQEGFWGLGFASHPSDESRIAFFSNAAKGH